MTAPANAYRRGLRRGGHGGGDVYDRMTTGRAMVVGASVGREACIFEQGNTKLRLRSPEAAELDCASMHWTVTTSPKNVRRTSGAISGPGNEAAPSSFGINKDRSSID